MDAMAHFGVRIGNVLRTKSLVDGFPALAAIIGAESSGCRNSDVDPLGIAWIQNDCMQAHSTCSWLPLGAGTMTSQAREFLPTLPTISGAEQRRIFNACI